MPGRPGSLTACAGEIAMLAVLMIEESALQTQGIAGRALAWALAIEQLECHVRDIVKPSSFVKQLRRH